MAEIKKEIQKKDGRKIETVERTRSGKVFVPAVDIIDSENELVLLADIPGSKENSIDITLENNLLTIQGNVSWNDPEGYEPSYIEYEVGDFQRSFTVDETIDRDKIKAKYKNGVLRLTLPKTEPIKPRKISVDVE